MRSSISEGLTDKLLAFGELSPGELTHSEISGSICSATGSGNGQVLLLRFANGSSHEAPGGNLADQETLDSDSISTGRGSGLVCAFTFRKRELKFKKGSDSIDVLSGSGDAHERAFTFCERNAQVGCERLEKKRRRSERGGRRRVFILAAGSGRIRR